MNRMEVEMRKLAVKRIFLFQIYLVKYLCHFLGETRNTLRTHAGRLRRNETPWLISFSKLKLLVSRTTINK